MKPPARLLSLVLAAVVCVGLGSQLYGQRRRPPQPELPAAVFSGKVDGVRSNMLQVTANEQKFVVQVGPTSKVFVEGPADTSFLRKGVYVNFTVQLDSRGNAEQELSEILIFTRSDVARPAVQQEGAEENSYYVAGQIQSLSKTGKLTVVVRETKGTSRRLVTVTGQLAKDAKVSLAVRDPSAIRLVRAGAEIEVNGKLARPASARMPGVVLGEDLRITLPALPEKPEKAAETEEKADE